MHKAFSLFLFAVSFALSAKAQKPSDPHGLELTGKNPEYTDVVKYYEAMDKRHKNIFMTIAGTTDTDDSLLVVYYSGDGKFDVKQWKDQHKMIVLINNGIHPGEPDGIVASMQLLWDIAEKKYTVPEHVVLAIIPVFNIHGAKSLREFTRVNQNGPKMTGFRGNAQNLDLNRDFIKMDARETFSLVRLMRKLDPDVLIDNHVSNGADYQHIMTLLTTQHNKLGGRLGDYLFNKFEPAIYDDMKKRGYDLVPYVNVWGKSPEKGWVGFLETPRFLSGYAALFHTLAFVAETHMLKPFPDRVAATYTLMQSIIEQTGKNADSIRDYRSQQHYRMLNSTMMDIEWRPDTVRPLMIEYKGYKSGMMPSAVSGKPALYYDRSKPYTASIPFYNFYEPANTVGVPNAYVIKQGWNKVIERLEANGVIMRKMTRDTVMKLVCYKVKNYKTTPSPYEGHYLHSDIEGEVDTKELTIKKGDYIVYTSQPARRYIVESLELNAPDGFFAWGFFDAILQQKEHYSAYAFETLAPELLDRNHDLRKALEEKRAADPEFAKDGKAQLEFVFQNSAYHEPEHMLYPVFRLEY